MTNWISVEDLKNLLRDIPAKHILIIADACFSGTMLRNRSPNNFLPESKLKKARVAITSGSLESVPDYSTFMYYLTKTLEESQDSILSAAEIHASIQEPVKLNSNDNNDPQYGHIKNSGHEGGDFFLIKKRVPQ